MIIDPGLPLIARPIAASNPGPSAVEPLSTRFFSCLVIFWEDCEIVSESSLSAFFRP